REGERDRDALRVTHLTDEYDVGVLTQCSPKRPLERLGVNADLTLVNNGDLVLVEVLDRILDRDDVTRPHHVDRVDHRGHRGRLTGSGRSAEEDESLLQRDELSGGERQADLVEGGDRALDQPERNGGEAPLVERVATEAVRAVREREVLVTVAL